MSKLMERRDVRFRTATAQPRGAPARPVRPVRIAVIGLRGAPGVIGGIETHCEWLYPALATALPETSIVLLARNAHMPTRRSWLSQHVRIRSLPAPSAAGLETLFHTPLALLYARLRLRARIVHLHAIGPGFFAPLARLLGMRVIVTHHAADFARPKWSAAARAFLRLGEAMAARAANRIVCVSEALHRDFLSRHPGAAARTTTIRHGAWIDTISDAARDRLLAAEGLTPGGYVLAVGRIEATKRFDDLIAAHAAAGPEAPPLVIVGASVDDPDYEAALRATAGSKVIFAGFRVGEELAALYRGAAAFVHASEMEGFGLVVLEAMLAGLPVRLSDIAPHREFGLPASCYFPVGYREGIAAALHPTGDAPGEAAAREAILRDHSIASAAARHAALFRDLLPAGQRAATTVSNTAQY